MAVPSYKKFFNIEEIVREIEKYNPSFNDERFLQAFYFAEQAHRGQLRKDGSTPYIVHPVEAVKILTSIHADEDTLISALLHDVPEDTEHTLDEIKKLFGEKIVFLIDGITKLSKVHYQHNMPERQVESLKKLLLHSTEDLRVILIKLADRLHNMRTLQHVPQPEKRLRIAKETIEIYVPIANLLGIRELKSQLEDLCFQYIFPTEYQALNKKLNSYAKKQAVNVKKFIKVMDEAFKANHLEIEILNRSKSLYSIYKKLSHLGKTIDEVDDRIGVKIIVKDIAKCYQALGVVHTTFVPKTDRFKDYISKPKTNGYQSLHTTVFGADGVLTEIQIRTKKMDMQAELGIAAEFFEFKGDDKSDFKRVLWVKKIIELDKGGRNSQDFLENLKLDIFQDRIFVFTPKGLTIDLPKEATVIDFAYAIHSEIGNHAVKADVNGNIKPISTALHNRDVVEVLSSRNITPEISWLSFAKTNLAKTKILFYLKKISKDKKLKEGHKILQKEFDISGLGICESFPFKKVQLILERSFGKAFNSLDEVFVAIGEGEVNAGDIAKEISDNYRYAGRFKAKNNGKQLKKGFKVFLKVVAKNRFGLLKDISEVLYKDVLDMYSLKGWASKYEEDAYFTTEILVDDLATISHIFDELYQIEGVRYVYRITSK
ncbi:MAG: RelA/SpoT family protein, partial [Patescibacteria group bacterium]